MAVPSMLSLGIRDGPAKDNKSAWRRAHAAARVLSLLFETYPVKEANIMAIVPRRVFFSSTRIHQDATLRPSQVQHSPLARSRALQLK